MSKRASSITSKLLASDPVTMSRPSPTIFIGPCRPSGQLVSIDVVRLKEFADLAGI